MRRITFAVAATLVLGALTLALPKLKSDVRANPVAKPAAAPFGDACKNVKFKFTKQRYDGAKIGFQSLRLQGSQVIAQTACAISHMAYGLTIYPELFSRRCTG